jgi:hypothetical protein
MNSLLSIELTEDYLANKQVRDIFMWTKKIWRLLISVQNYSEIVTDVYVSDSKYDHNEIWVNWSTKNTWIWFYEVESSLSDDSLWYESIQNSIDSTLWIGFVNDFKNITNFGAGDAVWKSTIPFGSEFLINIGDPLLKRIDDNEVWRM